MRVRRLRQVRHKRQFHRLRSGPHRHRRECPPERVSRRRDLLRRQRRYRLARLRRPGTTGQRERRGCAGFLPPGHRCRWAEHSGHQWGSDRIRLEGKWRRLQRDLGAPHVPRWRGARRIAECRERGGKRQGRSGHGRRWRPEHRPDRILRSPKRRRRLRRRLHPSGGRYQPVRSAGRRWAGRCARRPPLRLGCRRHHRLALPGARDQRPSGRDER